MNGKAKATLLCTVLLLAGCSDSNGINESDFIEALNTSERRSICFSKGVLGLATYGSEDGDQYLAEKMTALRVGLDTIPKLIEKGYLEKEPIKLRVKFQSHDSYKLTEKGRKYFKWSEPLCIGDTTATNVVEYTEPAENGGTKSTTVTFSYDINLNEFPSDTGLEEQLRKDLGLDGEGKALFTKTNKGWRLDKEW